MRPVFVINLDRDKARLLDIDRALRSIGVDYERVRAIDAKARMGLLRRLIRKPMYSERARRALTPGEVGCVLSHISTLKRVMRRRLPIAIILEDDAQWDSRFKGFLERDVARLLRYCDVLKFEGLRPSKRPGMGIPLFRGQTARVVIPLAPSWGTAGYAVTLRGAQLLAEALGRLDEPADFILPRYERYKIVLGETRPFLAWQGEYPTNLEPVRWELAPVTATSRRAPLVRRLAKRLEGMFSRWVFVTRTLCRARPSPEP
jgi:glycosyl transferase, family 25